VTFPQAIRQDARQPQACQHKPQEQIELRAEENKRLDARKKLKENETKIEATVYQRGINLPTEFATFKNK
jgi:hypothetical protein